MPAWLDDRRPAASPTWRGRVGKLLDRALRAVLKPGELLLLSEFMQGLHADRIARRHGLQTLVVESALLRLPSRRPVAVASSARTRADRPPTAPAVQSNSPSPRRAVRANRSAWGEGFDRARSHPSCQLLVRPRQREGFVGTWRRRWRPESAEAQASRPVPRPSVSAGPSGCCLQRSQGRSEEASQFCPACWLSMVPTVGQPFVTWPSLVLQHRSSH